MTDEDWALLEGFEERVNECYRRLEYVRCTRRIPADPADWDIVLDDAKRLAARLRELLEDKERPQSRGWLIEDNASNGWWWDGRVFVKDANWALRFSRKEDAERAILVGLVTPPGPMGIRATEHMWLDAARQKESK